MVRKLVIGLTAVVAAAAGMVSGHARGDSVVAARPTGPTGCMTEPAFARGESGRPRDRPRALGRGRGHGRLGDGGPIRVGWRRGRRDDPPRGG